MNCGSFCLLLRVALFLLYLPLLFSCRDATTLTQVSRQHQHTELTSHPTYPSYRTIEANAFELDGKKVELGRLLFHDVRLSSDNTISCSSCHNLRVVGIDSLARSIGVKGRRSEFNTPTVFNAAFNFRQFWDGRVHTLEQQISGPVHNPKEMDSNWPQIIDKLSQDTELQRRFRESYPQGIDQNAIVDAIASFERTLLTPDSPFDQFLKGNEAALSEQAKKGFALFNQLGCSSCHQGVNLGGNMYQVLGVMRDYFSRSGEVKHSDYGLYNSTKKEQDKFKFKVPGLRNVVHTAPYFHDGSVETIEEAVGIMAYYQLGVKLEDGQIAELVAFLRALTGKPFQTDSESL